VTSLADRSTHLLPARSSSLADRLRRVVMVTLGLDLLVVAGSIMLAWQVSEALSPFFPQSMEFDKFSSILVVLVFLTWMVFLSVRGGYRRRNIGAGYDEFRLVASASFVAFAFIASAGFLAHIPISRRFLILAFVIGLPLLLIERYAVRKVVHGLRRRGHLCGRVIAVCTPSALSELMGTLERMSHLGYTVAGTCVPDTDASRDLTLPVPCYGGVDDLVAACEETGADVVIVGGGGYSTSMALRRIGWAIEGPLRRIGWAIEGRSIELVVVPGLIDVAGPRIHMRHVSGLPLVHVEEPQVSRAGGWAKRAFDVVIASLMLMILSPLMLLIALATKLQDGGPVFYRQERSGRGGERFQMTKYRSMVVDADRGLDDLMDFNDVDDVLFKMHNDPRITRVGKLLRRWSLDELPQLFDVLRGNMSLVGPRPPLPREVEQYPPDMHRRLLVRPGLTGLWQVSGRSDLSFDEAIRMDLYYVDNWSILGDIIIILKTVRAVLKGHGAY
jgi:exopolysaccharide biosynthesis polyprenyl glycosylphosphotransferase